MECPRKSKSISSSLFCGKGTGLGLSVVYGIANQSGDLIEVYSDIGKGTIFKIYMPKVKGAVKQDLGRSMSSGLPVGHETILLIEDEREVRNLAKLILSKCGYIVLEAANPEEALDVCARNSSSIDLLLTDVVMPVAGGRKLSEQLLSIYPAIRVMQLLRRMMAKAVIRKTSAELS